MKKVFYDINLDFKKRGYVHLAPLIVKQGDFGARVIRAKMHIDGEPQKLADEEIILRLLRSDGKPCCIEGEIDENGCACITLDKTALSEKGKLSAEIVVNGDTYSISSQVFLVMVEPAAVSDGVINALEEKDILHKLINDVLVLRTSIENEDAEFKTTLLSEIESFKQEMRRGILGIKEENTAFREMMLCEFEKFKAEVRRGILGTFIFREHNELAGEFIECLTYPARADKYGLFDAETGVAVGDITKTGQSIYLPKQMAEVPLIIKYFDNGIETEKGELIISRVSDTGYYISGEIRSC